MADTSLLAARNRDASQANAAFHSTCKAGDAGVAERKQILLDHADALKERRSDIEKCESVLAIKIASYDALPKETAE